MSRKRYISSKISTDGAFSRLSFAAALLYTLSIPHAEDDCRLPPTTFEDWRLLVMPGFKCTAEDVAGYYNEIAAERLMGQDPADGRFYFPAETFYKIQTVIKQPNRRETPEIPTLDGKAAPEEKLRSTTKTPENLAEQSCTTKTAENSAPIPSPLSSPFPVPISRSAGALLSRARTELSLVKDEDDLGLGDRHPGSLAGWDVWNRFEANCNARGKRLPFHTIEAMGQSLMKWQLGGSEPRAVVEKAIVCGWMQLVDLDPRDKSPPGQDFDSAAALASITATANKFRVV